MPINIAELDKLTTQVNAYQPKFFDNKLTGRGGNTTIGLLSEKNNPTHIDPDVLTADANAKMSRKTYQNGLTNVCQIPVNPIPCEAWDYMESLTDPNLDRMVKIGTRNNTTLYFGMEINAMKIEETVTPPQNGVGQATREKNFVTNYQIMFLAQNNPNRTTYKKQTSIRLFPTHNNHYYMFHSDNPIADIRSKRILSDLISDGFTLDQTIMSDYLNNYDLYDSVCYRSEQWQTQMDTIVEQYMQNIHKLSGNKPSTKGSYMSRITEYYMRYLMTYSIPLNLYKHIYQSIANHMSADDATNLCKQNLNLLLSDTLQNLDNHKNLIPALTPPNPPTNLPASVQKLSTEQFQAVSSTEPLILVQAGAGTGKSTLILGRIDYLIACGVNPDDITVLSFTNAAADHIHEKNPNIHSMTIARMIHDIYSENFSGHELSSIDTILNSLDIYYPKQMSTNNPIPSNTLALIDSFRRHLISLQKNDGNSFTEMNNFIEKNYDEIIKILDTIHQTSLELEIIICYQKIGQFKEPASVASKYLIIDEVQDNSIFEFVYTLKYIDKHHESLFIVGDCSQTLYEFRASNPRALNILEGSGTFATYQLNINYRSNQDILDFANILLDNIEANQYAHIRLNANSMVPTTEQSFLEHVRFNYHRLNKLTEFSNALTSMMASEIKPYIDECLKRNEQVAFLAFTRNDIFNISKHLETMYPGRVIANLIPDKTRNNTVFSLFIRKFWDRVVFLPIKNVWKNIEREIVQNVDYLVPRYKDPMQIAGPILADFEAQNGALIKNWENQTIHGQMTSQNLFHLIREAMLQFEIQKNAIKQALVSANNKSKKQDFQQMNPDFLLSTIHSAKGLEFDNVVVFMRNENNMDEEKKRMYYVALTRAMKTEYVMAYDTVASPQIEANYVAVLQKLHEYAPAPNSPLNRLTSNISKRIQI